VTGFGGAPSWAHRVRGCRDHMPSTAKALAEPATLDPVGGMSERSCYSVLRINMQTTHAMLLGRLMTVGMLTT
jgi:hypothetical protein